MPFSTKKQTTLKVELVVDKHSTEHEAVERKIAHALKPHILEVLGDIPTAADVKKVRITIESEDN